jgi:HlyD family secretion protein
MKKESAMTAPARSPRLFIIVGALLLIGTALGAGFLFNNGVSGSGHPTPGAKDQPVASTTVICIGWVDDEAGVSGLYPVQPGRVVELREEGFVAKKGDWLLRLDNRFARYRLQGAKANRDAALAQLRQAKSLPEQHASKIEQQKAAVAAARFHKAAKDEELKLKKKGVADQVANKFDLAATEQAVEMLKSLVNVEEGKLHELTLIDPTVDLNRAQADLAAKEAQLEQAELGLIECDILAPTAGTLLRTLVHVGETLGSNPKMPALQFAQEGPKIIRAEVQQEWASRVRVGQKVSIEDDTSVGSQSPWAGKVKLLSQWFTPKRHPVVEPFMFNDVRTLECIIEIADQNAPLRIGQRVRVKIHTGS